MKHLGRIIATSSAPAFFVLGLHQTAGDPYLDAGTGSIIVQALIGGFVGGLFALKIFWGRISTFFKKLFSGGTRHGESTK